MELKNLQKKTLQWSREVGILANSNIAAQALKLGSEVGELLDNAAKDNRVDIKDDIGDCLVVLSNIAWMAGTTLEHCWEIAYRDIKDRKGLLSESGIFVKTTDKNFDILGKGSKLKTTDKNSDILGKGSKLKTTEEDYKSLRGSKIKKITVIDTFYDHFFIVIFDDMRIKIPGLSNIDMEELESFKGKYLHEFKEFLLSKRAYDGM